MRIETASGQHQTATTQWSKQRSLTLRVESLEAKVKELEMQLKDAKKLEMQVKDAKK